MANAYLTYDQMTIEGVKEVNQKINELLGVDVHQFKQIVMIAQGEFTKLIYASSEEREKVLRHIFHTESIVKFEEMLKEKKSQYVGTEKINTKKEKSDLSILKKSALLKVYYDQIAEQDEKRALIVKKFFEDMEDNLRCVYSQMNIGGKYVIVIGNSTIRKVNVESWRVIEEIANKMGFKTVQYFNYIIQNPYIRIPRKGMGGKINKDYVLVLEKGV